jgi:hypothetical protein
MMKKDIQTFTEEDDIKILTAFSYGAKIKEVCLETGFDYDRIMKWLAIGDNNTKAEMAALRPILDSKKTLAEKVKTDEKTAQWYLSRNKETKADWSDRVELTGKDGKDLLPVPILNGIADDDNKG